ncbi:MAG TPA: hypothetical protein VGB18_01295 [Candidatus Thermoplasmatota archaeon]
MRAILLALVAVFGTFSGCLNEFEDPVDPHYMRISGIDVAAPIVTSGHVDLLVAVTLDNSGGKSPPVELQVKAFDTATQLLVVTNETSVGSIAKDKTEVIELGLRVPRTSSYRLEVLISEDGRVVQEGSVQLGQVGLLERNLFDTGLTISEMDFLARNVSGSRVTIEAKIYVTNEGSEPSKELRMQVKAREITTGLLADEAEATLSSIGPEATQTAEVQLNVPSGYNYEVEAVVWDREYIVERGTGAVQLLPTFTKPKNEELIVSSPKLDDFVRGGGGAGGGSPGGTITRTPGLSLVLVAAVFAATAIVISRRKEA